jgi:cytochrome P450
VALESNAESALPYPMFINTDPPHHTEVRRRLHSCLGAALARLEARVVMEEILKHMPDYVIDVSGLEMAHNPNVRGYSRMPVTFTPRALRTAA